MTVPQRGSKFDMRLNPVYQVDWTNQASGKVIAASKRRLRFRFGFSDADAVKAGCTGPACRGEEHDVVLVWSLTSGKRLVTADDKEIHFSLGNVTDSMFETSWTMAGGHAIKIVAYAIPPLFYTPGYRQFDLLIDGCSFFDMPRIFELGIKNNEIRSIVQSPENSDQSYSLASSVKRYLAEPPTPEEHRVSRRNHVLDTTPDVVDLLSLEFELSPPCSLLESPTTSQQGRTGVSAPTVSALSNEPHTYYSPAPKQQHQHEPIAATVSPASPPRYYQQAQQAYYQQPQQTYYHPQQNYYQYPPQTPTCATSNAPAMNTPPPMTPFTVESLSSVLSIKGGQEERDAPPVSPMDGTVRSLVNLEDTAAPAPACTIETPELRKFQQFKVARQPAPVRSQPLPPVSPDWTLGLTSRMGEIQHHHHHATATPKLLQQQQQQSAKEIMRTHAFDPTATQAAGMMVPSYHRGAPQGYYCQQ